MRNLHVLSNVDPLAKHGDCARCGVRTLLFLRGEKWACTQRPVERARMHRQGRPLQHQLTAVDEEQRTGVCVLCGPVRIYPSIEGRTKYRKGQLWVCGKRPPERGVGGVTTHILTEVNVDAKTAVCALCGPTKIIWRPYYTGHGVWGCFRTRFSVGGQSAYSWSEEFKAAICPFCQKAHRWDRDSGKQCRARLIERDGNHCAVCLKEFGNTTPCVDHNHLTGVVRGLLCKQCNVAAGLLKDDVAVAERLAAYLRR